MKREELLIKSKSYVNTLCNEINERCVGSEGNRQATSFFEKVISSFGWETRTNGFDAVDWEGGKAIIKCGEECFDVLPGPYSIGCELEAELCAVSSIEELGKADLKEKIVIFYSNIAKEQIMPKNFVFYNPEHHQKIVSLLENSGVKAIIAATGLNAAVAGGVYPFPMFEDGDFHIPSVYMKDVDGEKLLPFAGKKVYLKSDSRRITGKGYNVTALKGKNPGRRIAVTAHIDAKKGTPGAIDNATGVTVLLLLAELLKNYEGDKQIEITAFNGEDYYAVPGQMLYMSENTGRFNEIILNINIDGAAYKKGATAFSLFNLSDDINQITQKIIDEYPEVKEGAQWVQGDHSIFVQNGCPAIAVSSIWFIENMETQMITHTSKDNPEVVEYERIVDIVLALNELLTAI